MSMWDEATSEYVSKKKDPKVKKQFQREEGKGYRPSGLGSTGGLTEFVEKMQKKKTKIEMLWSKLF